MDGQRVNKAPSGKRKIWIAVGVVLAVLIGAYVGLCAWAGSQKYAVLTWSGDIYSSFRSMREQLQAGLNMGMAGIPWWT